jgi:glycosyltransferase involved in cell wall biosynthesis
LADGSAQRGLPTVVVYGRRRETPTELRPHFDERVRLVEVPGWGERKAVASVAAAARAARTLRRELRQLPGGVIHLHSSYAGFVGRLIPTGPRWRLFYSPHGYAFQYHTVSRLGRVLTRVSEAMLGRRGRTIAVSETEGAAAAALVGRRRVMVVQSGVELPDALPAPADGRFVVASLGRAVPHRHPAAVARIARTLGAELGADFVWLGDGTERELLSRAGVDVRGWLHRTEVTRGLAEAHAVLHLSDYEGFPLAVLEAMAVGRPVVATDLPTIREAVGDAALVVRDEAEAADALRMLLRNDELCKQLGLRARARVEEMFTREQMVERTLAVYGL